MRGDARRRRREQAVAASGPANEPAPPSHVEHREAIARLDAALLGLPDAMQAVLLMRYYEGGRRGAWRRRADAVRSDAVTARRRARVALPTAAIRAAAA
jgi:DNA-directed RNA polymerase specialized sigma24 family protein